MASAATTLYAGQSSRRIRFSEDDSRTLIQLLAQARLSEDDDFEDDDNNLGALAKDDTVARKKENVPVQSGSADSPLLKGKGISTGDRKLGLLGGSARRVERKDGAEETPNVSTPRGKSGRDSVRTSGSMNTSRNSRASLNSSSFILESAMQSTQQLLGSKAGGGFTRRLIKTPIPLSSSPASPTVTTAAKAEVRPTELTSPQLASSALKKSKGQVGWSPMSSPLASPAPGLRKDLVASPGSPSTNQTRSPGSPSFLEEDYHEKEYDYHRVLGKGSFGKVLLASHRTTGKLVAVKVLDRKKLLERANLRRAHSEIRCLEKAGNNEHFVVGLSRAFETKSRIFIVQDFCIGGELFSVLQLNRRLSPEATRFYTAQCAVALAHLHSKRFAYRDLKTENIMLDSRGNVRLVDFGLVKEGMTHPDRGSRSFVGTTEYMAPEMLRRQGHGLAVDWWALGVVIHELLTGLPPWYCTEYVEMQRRVLNDPLVLDTAVLEPSAIATIAHLLDKNPLRRLGSTGDELSAVKSSLFFKSMDWEKLLAQRLKAPFVPDLDHESDLKYFAQEFLDLPVEV